MMSFLDVGGRTWEDLKGDPNVIHMGHNCNHLPIEPDIDEAMITAIRTGEYRDYPPPFGIGKLQELILTDLGISHARVLITNGSTEAIYQALAVILRPGDETIITDPAWPHIRNFALSLGSHVIEAPVYSHASGFRLQPDALMTLVSDRTRVIALIDPLNPLGSNYSNKELEAICNIASARGIYVLHDCTYRDFASSDSQPALRHYERAIVTISLSKSCGFAGLRLGAAVMHPALFDAVAEHQINRLGVSIVVQRGAVVAYQTKYRWLPRMLDANMQHQAAIEKCFRETRGVTTLVYPSSGNFVAADVTGTGLGAEDVVRKVLKAGFVIRSGAYTSSVFGERFIRVTTTVPRAHVDAFCGMFPELIGKDVSPVDVSQYAYALRSGHAC